jgi:hypothetical protein
MASNESGAVSRYLSLEQEDSDMGLFSAHFGTLRRGLVFVCWGGALLKLDGKRRRTSNSSSTLASDP